MQSAIFQADMCHVIELFVWAVQFIFWMIDDFAFYVNIQKTITAESAPIESKYWSKRLNHSVKKPQ